MARVGGAAASGDGAAASGDGAAAPFPLRGLLIISASLLTDGLVASSLFPFVPYLIADCGVPEPEVGYYAGLLASTYNFMQFLSAVFWGRVSDRHGRKPVMYVGLCGMVVSQVLFGLSKSVPWAIGCRAIGGLLNANGTVGKAFLRDITPPEHRPRVFSSLATVAGIGFLGGPTLGGLLAQPASTMPGLFDSALWWHYPFLLPCLASLLLAPLGLFTLPLIDEVTGPRAKLPKAAAGGGRVHPAPLQQPSDPAADGAAVGGGAAAGGAGAGAADRTSSSTRDAEAGGGGGAGVGEAEMAEAEMVEVSLDDGAGGGKAARDDNVLLSAARGVRQKKLLPRIGGSCAPGCARRCCKFLGSRLMSVAYASCIIGFVVVGMQELFPLFASNSRRRRVRTRVRQSMCDSLIVCLYVRPPIVCLSPLCVQSAAVERGLGMEPWELGLAISPMGVTLILWPMLMPTIIRLTSATFTFRAVRRTPSSSHVPPYSSRPKHARRTHAHTRAHTPRTSTHTRTHARTQTPPRPAGRPSHA